MPSKFKHPLIKIKCMRDDRSELYIRFSIPCSTTPYICWRIDDPVTFPEDFKQGTYYLGGILACYYSRHSSRLRISKLSDGSLGLYTNSTQIIHIPAKLIEPIHKFLLNVYVQN